LGAFLAQSAKNRAFRFNLFYRFAVKKDFRYNPLRERQRQTAKLPKAISRVLPYAVLCSRKKSQVFPGGPTLCAIFKIKLRITYFRPGSPPPELSARSHPFG
jgi:hypothetical protein